MKLTLERLPIGDKFTSGRIVSEAGTICMTLELPWLDNQHEISCIPEGTYQCVPIWHHKTESGHEFSQCVRVMNVLGREGVLIHPGNYLSETKGCILVGLKTAAGFSELLESVKALNYLISFCNNSEFDLDIKSITCTS